MSTLQNESHEGTGSEAAAGAERLDENPNRVSLIINGYEAPQGSAERLSLETIRRQHVSGDAYINWKRIAIPELRLEHAAHLLFLQGISPSQFFLAAGLRWYKEGVLREIPGPLLYITGLLTPAYATPARFTKLVIGQLIKSSSDKTNVSDTFLAMARYESKRHLHRGT
jgi:hypothetical protein